ncbi:hypothetical protein [Paraglaciecola aestuariivivens]
MLNKKLLAVAVATAFSTNVLADDTLVDPVYPELEVASQSLTVTSGMYTLTGQTVTTDLGFSIGNGTSKYVRYDLTNGEFNTITSLAGGVNVTATLSAGGDGESFAIYEVAAGANLAQTHDLVLTSTFDLSSTAKATIKYTLYETAQDAVDAGTGLATDSGDLAEVSDGMTGTFATKVALTALVAEDFKQFTGPTYTGVMGATDTDDLITAGLVNSAGAAWTAANIDNAATEVTFSGNFTFGTWTYGADQWGYDADGDLVVVAGTPTINTDGTVTVDYVQGETLDVTTGDATAADVALKGSYSAMLDGLSYTIGTAADFSATETIGSIVYDTTAIVVPYLTTFASYNQRLYIVNSGSQDASYTTSFVSEAGVTATAGTKATGVVPAGEMVTIKATDLVTLTGKTRTSATIEIEAELDNILATSQTVNLTNSGTDTTVLEVK